MSPSSSYSPSLSSFTITYFLILVSLTPLSLILSEESEQSQALPFREQVKSDKISLKVNLSKPTESISNLKGLSQIKAHAYTHAF